MTGFQKIGRFFRDVIIFNAFIFILYAIIVYGFGYDFSIRKDSLIAVNVGLMLYLLLRYR